MAYLDEVLADTPVGFWPLNEPYNGTSTQDFFDLSGNGHTGTMTGLSGTESFNVGGLPRTTGYSAGTDAINFVALPNAGPSGNNPYTLEVWTKVNSVGDGRGNLGYFGNWGSTGGAMFYGANVAVQLLHGAPGPNEVSTGTASIDDGLWHHLVGTYDLSDMRLYLDGTQVQILANTHGPDTTSVQNRFFTYGGSESNSNLPYVAMAMGAQYSTALSAVRVAAHYVAMLRNGVYAAAGCVGC